MTVFSVVFGSPSLSVCVYSQCLGCGYYKDSKMVLSSTGVLLVEWAPPECLLPGSVYPGSVPVAPTSPLWEILQDQQTSLTQVPFKLLLPWVSECVKFSVHPLRVQALFPIALWVFPKPAPLAFKAKHSGSSYSQSRSPGLGSPMGDSDSLRRTFAFDYPPICGSWLYRMSPHSHPLVVVPSESVNSVGHLRPEVPKQQEEINCKWQTLFKKFLF